MACMVATFFSKINLVKGYHQIPVAATEIPKTPIITAFGLFLVFVHAVWAV
jgi:hypothetical protein